MLVVEKDIEQYLKRRVEYFGGKCLKFVTSYETGIPDRIIILPGNTVAFVELKRPKGGKLSKIQQYQIGKLRALGCKVYVTKNKTEVDEALKELGVKDECKQMDT